MKTAIRTIGLGLAAIALAAASSMASADRGHRHYSGGRVHYGITFGVPLWYPGPYYSPYYNSYPGYSYPGYSYPAPVIVPPAPGVYVERDDVTVPQDRAAATSPYWYYCRDSNTYYPYVRECATPWERVPAAPSTAR